VNSGVAAMYTTSLTTWLTRCNEPNCFSVSASILSAAKRRWRIGQMNAEPGETVLGGGCVCGHDESSFQLPPAEMSAAIDVQDVTSDGRGVGQVHDRIRDVLDR
jgi:hypothetical protein